MDITAAPRKSAPIPRVMNAASSLAGLVQAATRRAEIS
jgi:hypothetical protein